MARQITLSDKTKNLIKKINQLENSLIKIPDDFIESPSIEQQRLLDWFNEAAHIHKKNLFLFESFRSSILMDIHNHLPETKPSAASIVKASWFSRFKFFLLALAGTIYVGCEGFDGISAILAVTSLPSSIILISGILFSLLSILVFFAFDLVEISKNLGVPLRNTPKLVDVYLQQIKNINAIVALIDDNLIHKNSDDISDDLRVIAVLKEKREAIGEASHPLKQALENPILKLAKAIAAGVAGIIFFSGGYFVGQTVALAIISFFIASATPAFWPVILLSTLIGVAAFSLYWFVERPGIENLIGRISGLDKEKIDTLCDSDEADSCLKNIDTIKNKLEAKQVELTRQRQQEETIAKQKNDIEQLKEENRLFQKQIKGFLTVTVSNASQATFFSTLSVELPVDKEKARLTAQCLDNGAVSSNSWNQ